jgi:hypothetical protein
VPHRRGGDCLGDLFFTDQQTDAAFVGAPATLAASRKVRPPSSRIRSPWRLSRRQ